MRRKLTDPENGLVLRRDVYWFNRMVKGVRSWHNLETSDLMTAIERKAEILRRPELIAEEDSIDRAIDRFLKYKVNKGEFRPISAANARSGLRRFAAFIGQEASLANVNVADLQRWYNAECDRGMASTAERYLLSVQSMLAWTVEVERIRHDNPAKRVERVEAASTKRIRYTTRSVRDELIAKASDPDMKFILYCGFHAGLRITEISEARVFWFDLDQKLLHVQATPLSRSVKAKDREIVEDQYGMQVRYFRTKGGDDRTVPLTEGFQTFLAKYLAGRNPAEFVGQPDRTCPKGFYRWKCQPAFKKFMREKGHGWISPHILRHTFASLLVMKGVSIYKVAKWLGDSLTVTEKTYAHLAPLDADIQHLE